MNIDSAPEVASLNIEPTEEKKELIEIQVVVEILDAHTIGSK